MNDGTRVKSSRGRWWGSRLLAGLALLALAAACESGQEDTRTFRLNRMSGSEALYLVRGYVGEDDAVSVTESPPTVTVRGTAEELATVEELLAMHDRSPSNLALRFQVIEANGYQGADPAIADVEAALRELFRYEGYRLADELFVRAAEGGGFRQGSDRFIVEGQVREVNGGAGGYRVHLELELMAHDRGSVLNTSVNVPIGQTVVLGSASQGDAGALILVVRPEAEDPPVLSGGSPSPPR